MTEGRTRRLAAVWFADIVGYTALSTRNEDAALAVVDEFQRLSKDAVGDKGRVVKFLGDGALSVFDSTNRALESALALRDAFEASEVARRHGCTLSVGVHVGEVVEAEDGDVYGDGVNVASRIEGVASSNQVVVSEDVYRLIRNRPGYNPQPIGEHRLKGVDKPAPLFVLARPGEVVAAPVAAAAVPAATATTAQGGSHRRAVAVGTLAGVTGFVLLSLFVAWSVNVDDVPDAGVSTPTQGASSTTTGETPSTDAPAATAADRAPAPPGTASSTPPADAAADPAPSDAGPADATPVRTEPPAAPPAPAQTPVEAPSNRLLVLVFGDPPAGTAEAQILRSLGSVSGITAIDAPAAALLRRNPDAVRGALQGDFATLAQMARQQNIEYIVLGDFESSATPRGPMYGGSAQLGLRMYRVSTGEIVDSGVFGAGTGRGPAVPGATELGVRTQAAQDVGRQGAVAARRWLTTALRD